MKVCFDPQPAFTIVTDKDRQFLATIVTLVTVAAAEKLSQADAQARLEAAGISASSSGGCVDPSDGTCTSYEGINLATVEGAITLKEACACDVTITGGTETGHGTGEYSHANGYKLDLAKEGGLDGYVTGTFTQIEDRGDGYPQWEAGSGNIYCVSLRRVSMLGSAALTCAF